MITTPPSATLPDPKLEPFLTIPRISRILACSPRAAYNLAETGGLPIVKVGTRGIRVPTAQFLRQYGLTEPTPE
jgi:hypothetical protein